jgi:hypothetical protein
VIELLFFSLINRVTYNGIRSALELGIGYEYYLDVFCINVAVQALCGFSDYFWVIYAVIPGYLGFYAFKYFLIWANSTGTKEEEEDEGQKKKKQRVKYLKARK